MQKYLVSFLVSILCGTALFGQTGKITGKIKDESNNSPLANASIVSSLQKVSASSDFEGDYSLELPEGSYSIVVRYVGYEAKEIKDIAVRSGKVTELDITLLPESDVLDEVVVSVSARKNTEASILNMQKSAGVLMDGLSAQSIKRSGASDIASAIRTVPGVSVQEGKFIYVRGLGDRYTKSILNGVDIPGLDPDKNTIQMDIFPTSILENIVVTKSASAELPADFTGGVVDIVTKDFPSRKQVGINFSLGANPAMNFNSDYLTYSGGKTDFLGFDDGTRKLPISPNATIPLPASSDNNSLEGITRSFDPILGANTKTSLPNFSLGFNFGNQYQLGDNKLGVIASIDYRNTTEYYKDFRNGIYQKPEERTDYEILVDRRQRGSLGLNNVLGSALLGLNYKTDRAKYTLNVLHVQNGESRAAIFDQETRISNDINVVRNNLEYTQRSISNILVSGKHSNADASFLTEWKLSPTFSKVNDKDLRLTSFKREPDGTFTINSDSGFPTRLWRNLDEINAVNKVDFTKKHTLFDNSAFLKFGALYSYKQRDYSINNYDIGTRGVETRDLQGDPNNILKDENVWTPETNLGYFIRGDFQAQNTFDAAQHTAAAYVSSEFKPIEKLRTIVGLRVEKFMTYFTGQNNSGTEVYDNEKTIDKLDLFPSLNLIYGLNAQNNIRLSYSRTTARPSFKELSIVQIPDLLTGVNFLGNIDLEPAYINNFDLRYEMYGDRAQMFAVSAFYKQFKNPIEIVAYSSAAPNDFTPRNTSEAQVYGVEFEVRKNFEFVHEGLKDLSLNANVSLVHSVIEMSKVVGGEYESRQAFARTDEEIEDTRSLQGQSPYLINAGLSYNNTENGLEAGVFYNVQGKTLDVVGFGKNPDVYVQPFNSLNFNFSKRVGASKHGSISVKAENILGAERKSLYESYKANTQEFLFRAPGRTFSIGYSYNF
ncbi:TonB-dependent receptor [Sphingobacterium alkalisoli]|uniref:TonB-dependent receptor n=1 Tax=Sphingobacterium alkalisoli TaxID=1874115 RepID=A0A4V5LYH4_9SPHI|nr:TonB-dependent receptor [Sphingobacterium alkalisoli]TJY66539.1 TonB-dependent receptor [Sphingobacterium alkalisoli]GGH15775.1 outer membrane protein [Sphingobacterium alkalisoli]